MTYLVVNNEFRIFIKHRILSFSERFEVFQHFSWINVRWCRILKVISFLNDGGNIAGIAVVNEILQEENYCTLNKHSTDTKVQSLTTLNNYDSMGDCLKKQLSPPKSAIQPSPPPLPPPARSNLFLLSLSFQLQLKPPLFHLAIFFARTSKKRM